jgi:hypothetical protein
VLALVLVDCSAYSAPISLGSRLRSLGAEDKGYSSYYGGDSGGAEEDDGKQQWVAGLPYSKGKVGDGPVPFLSRVAGDFLRASIPFAGPAGDASGATSVDNASLSSSQVLLQLILLFGNCGVPLIGRHNR